MLNSITIYKNSVTSEVYKKYFESAKTLCPIKKVKIDLRMMVNDFGGSEVPDWEIGAANC